MTKADKCTQKERSERISQWTVLIPRAEPLTVSSQTGFGLEKVWKNLIAAAEESEFYHPVIEESPSPQEDDADKKFYEVAEISIEILSDEPPEESEKAEEQSEQTGVSAQLPEKPKKARRGGTGTRSPKESGTGKGTAESKSRKIPRKT